MRKLLLVGLIAAAPMLVAPNTASAWAADTDTATLRVTSATPLHATPTATPRRVTTATAMPVLAGGSTVREPTAGVAD
jgi:hypothetical protein